MCYYCGRRAKTTAGIVWGVPVKITELGAHVEGYLTTQPTILALRCCHRFGKGPEAHIRSLPNELVNLVADYVLRPAQEEARSEWERDFLCFEEKCDIRDHYTEGELQELMDSVMADIDMCNHGIDSEDEDTMDMFEEMMDELLWQEGPGEEHFSRKDKWRHRVVQKHPHRRISDGSEDWVDGPFTKYDDVGDLFIGQQLCYDEGDLVTLQQVLKTNFGLQAYITHQVIPEAMKPYINHVSNRWEQHDETTLAWLTLPCTIISDEVNMEEYVSSKYKYHVLVFCTLPHIVPSKCYSSGVSDGNITGSGHQSEGEFQATSTMSALINPNSLRLTDSMSARFTRAMNALNVKSFVHPTQLQLRMSAFEKDNSAGNSAGPVPKMKTWKRTFYRKDSDEQARLRKNVQDKVKRLENAKWPQLINIVSSDYQL